MPRRIGRLLRARKDYGRLRALLDLLTLRGTSQFLYRVSHAAGTRAPLLGTIVKQLNHALTGADIAWQATIGPGLSLLHPTAVVIGREVIIGSHCTLQSCVTLGGKGGQDDGHPIVGDNVLIGAGARVLGKIRIGDNAIIGANAVVLTDVPADHTAVGVPALSRLTRS